jgi:phage terminase small subunit
LPEESKFTPKQTLFIYEYCSNGFNQTQAAIDAGYSPDCAYQQGYENLNKPEIKAAIDKLIAERIMPKDQVIKRISDIARGNIKEYLVIKQVAVENRVKVPLAVLIQRTRWKMEDEAKFFERSAQAMTDARKKRYEENIEDWLDEILRYEIELERNPDAFRDEAGEPVMEDRVELDLVKLARDKERGIIKKFTWSKKGGYEVELYNADDSLRDLGRHYGIFEKDNNQQPAPVFNMANFSSTDLNTLLALKAKVAK